MLLLNKKTLIKCEDKLRTEFCNHRKDSKCWIQKHIINQSLFRILLKINLSPNLNFNGHGLLNVQNSKMFNGHKGFNGLKNKL